MIREQELFDALSAVSRSFADDGVPGGVPGDASVEAMNPEVRESLGEAALAVAYGAFASLDQAAGAMHMLVGATGLLALHSDEDANPAEEILGVLADDAMVESEVDRAGEALDRELGRDATADMQIASLEARIAGTAIMLAGCTLPAALDGQGAVRLRAARYLARIAAGLLAINAVDAAGGPRI